MPKKPRGTTLLDTQRGKKSERLLKSARQFFFQIFLPLWKRFSSKMSVLVVSEILRPFVNILTHDEKYSFSVNSWCISEVIDWKRRD